MNNEDRIQKELDRRLRENTDHLIVDPNKQSRSLLVQDFAPSLFEPAYENLAVVPFREVKLHSDSGIVAPDSSRSNIESVVVAVGAGRVVSGCKTLMPLLCKVGDVVIHAPSDGRDYVVEGSFVRILPESRIIGISRRKSHEFTVEDVQRAKRVKNAEDYRKWRAEIVETIARSLNDAT